MSFQPRPTYSGFIFLAVALFSGLTTLLLLGLLLERSDPAELINVLVGLVFALGLTVAALYWALVVFRLDYYLSRNGLAIRWGWGQLRIPLNRIERVVPGKDLSRPPTFRGVNLAGLHLGRGELDEDGPVSFRTTAPLAQSLLVVTANQAFVISPQNPDAFLKAWQLRRELGPTQQWTVQVRRQWPFNLPLLNDPLTWWLLGIAALICLALYGYISYRFEQIPPSLPIHFNSLGQADRIADKNVLFLLPAAGGLVLIVNTLLGSIVYHREKLATYLLWGSSVVMQLCLWVAALTIIG